MQTVQMNTRMEVGLKQEGDAILAEMGRTPTEAVRALWRFVVRHRSEPQVIEQILADGKDEDAAVEARLDAIGRGRALCRDFAPLFPELSGASHKELREALLDADERGRDDAGRAKGGASQ